MQTTLIVIYTDHLRECAAFYSGLGLPLQAEQHGNGPEHHAAELGTMVVELYPATEHRPATGSLRLGFRLPHHAAPRDLPPGRHLLTDPDGRTIDLEITENPA
ncbi:catechol 2,3-dioxygenase-like lactoylglutathione lyase family enzyme [Thermocatellispora tengchongensis]|uniref:Catechol 2,3-dioxygenase-like lactoylglutathione lyase family enzyme n=1 Tax=Thermocatellispora tengchongensis TaxID=1073253 RepID=A0A840PC85_9ACTN|nr:glyoxalase/bleomycin resistance/dioxygenase family protein [Thermocatellispora tengchongensis]MBB5136599.1 catechol 2,3-dioxygenase-like lactoylglutathione lyase family enzyme [Thermocatellispora tengchongensis]